MAAVLGTNAHAISAVATMTTTAAMKISVSVFVITHMAARACMSMPASPDLFHQRRRSSTIWRDRGRRVLSGKTRLSAKDVAARLLLQHRLVGGNTLLRLTSPLLVAPRKVARCRVICSRPRCRGGRGSTQRSASGFSNRA